MPTFEQCLINPGVVMDVPDKATYLNIKDADSLFENKKVCSFTGYRPEKMSFEKESDSRCIKLKFDLYSEIEKLIKKGYTEFISGMARGVDVWAAEIVLHFSRDSDRELHLYAAVPFPEQNEQWYRWEKERYDEVLRLCSGVFVIENKYTSDCMQKRNDFLMKYADSSMSVYDGKSGGSNYTLGSAGKKDLNIINIFI